METHIPLHKEKQLYTWLGIAFIMISVYLTSIASRFDPYEALAIVPGVLKFIFTDFFPPAAGALPNIGVPLLDTVCMAVVSTILAAAVSLVLALLAAAPTTPHPAVKMLVRGGVSLLRNIPSLAWTLILVPAFGIGKFVGLIALCIGSVGTLTRFFAESVEEINLGGIEAIRSVGGSYWQTLKCGVIPQCTPSLISWTLYNLELNIRASTIIGMVGGGGIGMYIQFTVKLFRYDHAAMAIILVAVTVLILEYISKKIRSFLL
ncbi:MAG: phosphonate ABC transporter, permease protein PhnE [Spirochaetales bacterium]|nr:phosphonate ABC transporter, permease protein PhnE [Spirochaetales bacterium]